jgi:DNA-binding GntR family transcriptional regulator
MSHSAGKDAGKSSSDVNRARTSAEYVLDGLRKALITGALAPGDRVRQEDFASSLGVSLAPVREALAVLEQEGQVTYQPRRGYFVTALDIDDYREIYELRSLLESRAVSIAMPQLDDETLGRIESAARECVEAADRNDVAAELEANRRFHFQTFGSADELLHTLKLIRLLWDSTETYRALYFNSEVARNDSIVAHERILGALRDRDLDLLLDALESHREEALEGVSKILSAPS